jgi:DNA-binding HxlR family transcriptional regulator
MPVSTPPEVPPCGCGAPGRANPATCYCSVEELLKVIRRRYSLALMNAILLGQPARFSELAQALPQASSSTLAETLVALEIAQLIVRTTSDRPPTVSYSLTDSGTKLINRLRPLLDEVQR